MCFSTGYSYTVPQLREGAFRLTHLRCSSSGCPLHSRPGALDPRRSRRAADAIASLDGLASCAVSGARGVVTLRGSAIRIFSWRSIGAKAAHPAPAPCQRQGPSALAAASLAGPAVVPPWLLLDALALEATQRVLVFLAVLAAIQLAALATGAGHTAGR